MARLQVMNVKHSSNATKLYFFFVFTCVLSK